MTLLYTIGIRLYYILVLIASVFNNKAALWINGRKEVFKKLKEAFKDNTQTVYWFHAASLGEFEQGRPLMEAVKQENPNIKIALTFFSPSGYEIRKNYEHADFICYLPLDTTWNAKKFISLLKPQKCFFIKYEYWRNFLRQAKNNNSEIYLVSGIFRNNQLFFKPYGAWYRKMLTHFKHFFVQNEESGELLKNIRLNNYSITGDSRFDRVVQIANDCKEIKLVKAFANHSELIVAGSTWEADEDILIKYIESDNNNLKLVLAPHEINKAHIESIKQKINCPYACYSELKNTTDLNDETQILIIDNIGMLSSLYQYATITYIGGGFGSGIHNTLEAAVYGKPVIFGPNYQKFQEATDLIRCGGGFSITGYKSFTELLSLLLSTKNDRTKAGEKCKSYVNKMQGATLFIINYLKNN